MALFNQKPVAVIVFIVLFIISIPIGGATSLNKLQKQAANAFSIGVDGDGYSIEKDLNAKLGATYNMITIANRYDPENQAVLYLSKAREDLIAADTTREKYNCHIRLTEASTALYNQFMSFSLTNQDATLAEGLWQEIRSLDYTIARNGYNQMAVEYNSLLASFPGNMLKTLGLVQPVDLFQ